MLRLTLASKKPVKELWTHKTYPPIKSVQQQVLQQQPKPLINANMLTESLRRDRLIKDLVSKCKVKIGDICKPYDESLIEEYGDNIRVTHICDSYFKFGIKEKWPEGDNPMIIHAWSDKKDATFICTTEWLVKK